ncbi:Thiosulfate:glutathione sulfurtransferase [Taenia crassiceps]|uniref:Thiosulfate:glutathione sulfurtransferase n=1 Tax=Taenia crassiceps TaxID=6207 RepID=A0ABR4Q9F9_9CEST
MRRPPDDILKIRQLYKFTEGGNTFNPKIDVKTFNAIREEPKGAQLFDVREPGELESDGRIPGALNIPFGDVELAFALSDAEFNAKYGTPKPKVTDDNVIFFCKSGKRGLAACKSVQKYGYKRILNLDGGYLAWKEETKGENPEYS